MRVPTKPKQKTYSSKLVIAVLLVQATGAYAQMRPDAGTLLDGVLSPAPMPRTGSVAPLPAPSPSAIATDSSLKVKVRDFQVTGTTAIGDVDIKAVLAEFQGRELDMQGLNDALLAVKSLYLARGYFLAIPYLPKQDLSDGLVRIHVIEGRLGKVEIRQKPESRLAGGVVQRYMSVLGQGETINENNVYRALLLLGDLPGVGVKSTIRPGANVGEADLVVDVGNAGPRTGGGVEVDNHGVKFAGSTRLSGQMFVNDPLGLGDLFLLRGLTTQNDLTQVASVSYLVPVGPSGTKLGGSFTKLHYRLEGTTIKTDAANAQDLGALKASGSGDVSMLLVTHPVVRSVSFNLYAQLSADVKNTNDRVLTVANGTTFNLQDRTVRATRFTAVGDYRDTVFGGANSSFGLTVASGKALAKSRDALVADDNFSNSPGGANRIGSFTKLNAEFSRTQGLAGRTYGLFSFKGQWANRNLTATEKLGVGGPTAVRAYPVGEAPSDIGHVATAELRYEFSGVTVSTFIDGARVRRNIRQPPSDTASTGLSQPIGSLLPNTRGLLGAGFGLRLSGNRGTGTELYALTADVAWRIGSDRPQSDASRAPTIWVRASFSL